MKTYTKTHNSKKVAEIHLKKIKDRGGKATITSVKGGFQISYSFPEKKATTKKLYDVISPDGFTIRIGVEPFKSMREAKKYFEIWKKRFESQGYYSSVKHGRIHLLDLEDFCEWVEWDKNRLV